MVGSSAFLFTNQTLPIAEQRPVSRWMTYVEFYNEPEMIDIQKLLMDNIIPIIIAIVTAGISYGAMRGRVIDLEKEVAALRKKNDERYSSDITLAATLGELKTKVDFLYDRAKRLESEGGK